MKNVVWWMWLWLSACCLPFNANALEIMLPEVYSEEIDVVGWLMSEKLDGVRCYWDGKRLLSKSGKPLYAPASFIHNLPPFALEGELWGGRGTFEKTVSIVKRQYPHGGWSSLKFAVFDVPQASGDFISRLQKAMDWFDNHPSRFAFLIPQKLTRDQDYLKTELQCVEKQGGEGLVVRKTNAIYTKGRSPEILKVQSFNDMDAVVIDHIEGNGRNKGRLGSLLVELPDKSRVRIGRGFSDEKRKNPPPIGSVITFKYYGFYESGRPKFPSFLRVRPDTSL